MKTHFTQFIVIVLSFLAPKSGLSNEVSIHRDCIFSSPERNIQIDLVAVAKTRSELTSNPFYLALLFEDTAGHRRPLGQYVVKASGQNGRVERIEGDGFRLEIERGTPTDPALNGSLQAELPEGARLKLTAPAERLVLVCK